MTTKKNRKTDFSKKVEKAMKDVKVKATKVNDYALNTTEEVVTDTIEIANQWQKVTEKALKGGVQLLENQQNIMFDALETYKNHFVKGRKRFREIFA
ncbi:hypothetical protein [Polaribacter sp.]|uniref:hypothetical protein n=1 Tax=Polaribacter sp. TaxID=1920175 RepID=UPI003F6A6122